jgi:hypothetical protein
MSAMALTKTTDCTSRRVRAFLNPHNRKARCRAETGDISRTFVFLAADAT